MNNAVRVLSFCICSQRIQRKRKNKYDFALEFRLTYISTAEIQHLADRLCTFAYLRSRRVVRGGPGIY